MYKNSSNKNWASLFLLILCGIVLGSFIGYIFKDNTYLSWLAYGKKFGMDSPLSIDLSVISLQFGISLDVTIGSVLGAIGAIFVYKKL